MDTNPAWWRQRRAKEIARQKADKELQRVLRLEPKAWEVLTMARTQQFSVGYNLEHEYVHLKHRIERIVGWWARNPALRSHLAYEAMIHAVSRLLPPDVSELRASGDLTADEAEELHQAYITAGGTYDGYVPLSDDEIDRWLNAAEPRKHPKGA